MKVNELIDTINSSVDHSRVTVVRGQTDCNYIVDTPKECSEFWDTISKLDFVYTVFDTTLIVENETIIHPFRKGFFASGAYALNLAELSILFTELYQEIQATYSEDLLDPDTIAQSIGL